MQQVPVDIAEIVQLAAVDSILFEKTFFPQTARVAPALFHAEMNSILDGPDRFVNIEVFRGGAKTSKFRMYAAKRIAYGISRTIIIVGKNQDHALRTTRWLKHQIEFNTLLKNTFNLQKGAKWQDAEFQIINKSAGVNIWVTALGITGSVRGVNFDDYRPDLILVDDVLDEENASTPEQRKKTENLVLGALKHSLISEVEAPFAKLVILQTPIDSEDISQLAKKDPLFRSVRYGCWAAETEDLPLDMRESSWPALFPTETLKKERNAAAAQNRLSIFSREMECKLITVEDSKFREEWLQFYGEGESEPEPVWNELWIEIVIDPTPPPSETQIAKGFINKDFEAFAVVGKKKNKYYLLEISSNRGHEPSWTIAEFFRLATKWRPKKILVESVAYQRTLVWLLQNAMRSAGRYWLVEPYEDRRSKPIKIMDGITGIASNRQLYIDRRKHADFMSQYIAYPSVKHDDIIEAVAIGLTSLQRGWIGEDQDFNYKIVESEYESLSNYRGAP